MSCDPLESEAIAQGLRFAASAPLQRVAAALQLKRGSLAASDLQ
jgi:hypothetical protein